MAFLRFVAWLGKMAWKYGSKLPKMISWAWSHRSTITTWLGNGLTYYTIAELIIRYAF